MRVEIAFAAGRTVLKRRVFVPAARTDPAGGNRQVAHWNLDSIKTRIAARCNRDRKSTGGLGPNRFFTTVRFQEGILTCRMSQSGRSATVNLYKRASSRLACR